MKSFSQTWLVRLLLRQHYSNKDSNVVTGGETLGFVTQSHITDASSRDFEHCQYTHTQKSQQTEVTKHQNGKPKTTTKCFTCLGDRGNEEC